MRSCAPRYQAVCSGATGHAEAVRFEYDPSKVKYSDLVVRRVPAALPGGPIVRIWSVQASY